MKKPKHRTTWGIGALIAACAAGCAGPGGGRPVHEAPGAAFAPVVQVGEMRPVMREGKTEPRARVPSAGDQPHLFAVGAMAGLDGEITVADGNAWISRVVDGRPVTSGPAVAADARATLLIGFRVERWTAVTLAAPVAGGALEEAVERAAREHGIDTSRPFPFRVEGEFTTLDMHVINGFCPHSGGEASETNQPWRSAFAGPTRAAVVGVYARDSEGVLTHHGTAVHAHAIVPTDHGPITGHVDSLAVGAGATLLLPEAPRH